MNTHAALGVKSRATASAQQDMQPPERFENELIMDLERDQFVAETSRPLPPAHLSARERSGLLTLRIFVIILAIMVIYAFVEQLH